MRLLNLLAVIIVLSGCSAGNDKPADAAGAVQYAKRFGIRAVNGYTLVTTMGLKAGDTAAKFALYTGAPPRTEDAVPVKVPCRRIASLSSIYSAMLSELGQASRIVAIDNIDYVSDPQVTRRFREGRIAEVQRVPDIDVERTLEASPDIVFTFGMSPEDHPALRRTPLAVAVCLDHLEESPLARAEWIRFFAAFTCSDALADSLFRQTVDRYNYLSGLQKGLPGKPTAITEVRFGDTWYMPGGRSFMGHLLNDAGARFPWSSTPNAGSLPLGFEEVYEKGRNADYWLNVSTARTRAELLQLEPRAASFSAFSKGNVYNNNAHVNAKGYSSYWETGIAHPERILHDLIRIFHPSEPISPDTFYYYMKLP